MNQLYSRETQYTSGEEFCLVFSRNMNSLFQLSYALAADEGRAEALLLSALDDCIHGQAVVTEYAHSWAKRSIIKNAIRRTRPVPNQTGNTAMVATAIEIANPEIGARVLNLDNFERFVFVISILEGYPNQECAVLLGCTRADVRQARASAIKRMAPRRISSQPSSASQQRDTSHGSTELAVLCP